MNRTTRPAASLSIDLDNLWSYLKTHGDASWQARPTYLDAVVPPLLALLDSLALKLTVFVVGADAADPRNRNALRALAAAGHEFGNHSFEHEPWLGRYPREALEREIVQTDAAIEAACGQRPVGFRGPGYSWSAELLEVLKDQGHAFDASTLPTFIGPLARAYYFRGTTLTAAERETRRELFGRFSDGLRPNRPYRWQLRGDRTLLELPVSTFPLLRTPFHPSYLAWLAGLSRPLMSAYLDAALLACRASGTPPSVLLHPLDLIGGDVVPELSFFPGMAKSSHEKSALLREILERIAERFTLLPMGEFARRIEASGHLPTRIPD